MGTRMQKPWLLGTSSVKIQALSRSHNLSATPAFPSMSSNGGRPASAPIDLTLIACIQEVVFSGLPTEVIGCLDPVEITESYWNLQLKLNSWIFEWRESCLRSSSSLKTETTALSRSLRVRPVWTGSGPETTTLSSFKNSLRTALSRSEVLFLEIRPDRHRLFWGQQPQKWWLLPELALVGH